MNLNIDISFLVRVECFHQQTNKQAKMEKKTTKGRSKTTSVMLGRVIEGPTNVQHVSHLGFDAKNGFSMRNIPPEWRKLFQSAGVK